MGLVLLFSRYFFSSESLHRKQFSYSMRALPYTLYMILVSIFPLFRKFRKRDVTIFHVQLCIALFCMLIIFVCGINRTAIYGVCVAVSALIHYFTLVSVMFMGAEAAVMFQKLVLVFGSTSTKFFVTVSLICWRKCITVSLIPRPLPDFILQPWRKIRRRPGIIATLRTENGGLG